ncbi:MAG: hypothetical protein MUP40_06330, partial [Actinobacteria bacterium]|nr:hypothetical protein [Actinomycetota bacterium]
KRYDEPKTPYQRVLSSPDVDDLAKKRLKRQYAKLNPAKLKREILELQDRLYKYAVFKRGNVQEKAKQAADDLEYISL